MDIGNKITFECFKIQIITTLSCLVFYHDNDNIITFANKISPLNNLFIRKRFYTKFNNKIIWQYELFYIPLYQQKD